MRGCAMLLARNRFQCRGDAGCARAADAFRAMDRGAGAGLRRPLPHLGLGCRRHHGRHAASLRSLRPQAQARRRHHRARLRRRFGARRARARPQHPSPRHDDDGRQDRRPVPPTDGGKRRARLLPQAYCESMCAFVLLAGIERHVPAEARVLVHQIWLGDRRDDPTAANYSAEDLVVVQRDIGRLAQYTVEMGGGIDLLEIALRIPPWEPMRLLSREELRGMKIVTADDPSLEASSGAAMNSMAWRTACARRSTVAAGRCSPVASSPTLGRSHPLTIEGEEIGSIRIEFRLRRAGPRLRGELRRAAARRRPPHAGGSHCGRDIDARNVGAAEGRFLTVRMASRLKSVRSPAGGLRRSC